MSLSLFLAYFSPSIIHHDNNYIASMLSPHHLSHSVLIDQQQQQQCVDGTQCQQQQQQQQQPFRLHLVQSILQSLGIKQQDIMNMDADKEVLFNNVASSTVIIISLVISALGAILWQRSPFLGVLVYVVVVSSYVYDNSWIHFTKARDAMLFMAILLSFLSRHILRLNAASLAFIIASQWLSTHHQQEDIAQTLGLPAFYALALIYGLLINILYDLAVRKGYLIISGITQSIAVSIAAFIFVETFFELVGFNIQYKSNSYSFISRSWRDSLDAFIDNQSIRVQILHSLPAIGACFCIAGINRCMKQFKENSTSSVDNVIADILGLACGALAGVWLWIKCTGLTNIDLFGPSIVTFVSAMVLIRTSFILHTSPFPFAVIQSSWNTMVYWKKFVSAASKPKASANNSTDGAQDTDKNNKAILHADKSISWKIVNIFSCGVDPNVHKIGLRLLEADDASKVALNKVSELRNAKPEVDQIALARTMYASAVAMSTASKLMDELLLKLRDIVNEAESENLFLAKIDSKDNPSLITSDMKSKMQKKLKESLLRHKDLLNEEKEIGEDLSQKKMLLVKLEDDAISSLREVSIKVNGGKITLSNKDDNPKEIADELLHLAEGLQSKRKKSRSLGSKGMLLLLFVC